MGAKIIEKHITIDRHMKGTDQKGSLGPDGVNRMVRDIRVTERWLGEESLYIEPAVAAAKVKLERSIATKRALPAGHVITDDDIHLLSPGDGFKWVRKAEVVGHALKAPLGADEIIYPDNLL